MVFVGEIRLASEANCDACIVEFSHFARTPNHTAA